MPRLTFSIFHSVEALPANWNDAARGNIFLTREYLSVLESSAPENMTCRFIAIWDGNLLIATAISQLLDLRHVRSFGERDNCVKRRVRDFVFRRFSSRVLFLGNNMLTGQNAFSVPDDERRTDAITAIAEAFHSIPGMLPANLRPHILIWKDFPLSVKFPDQPFEKYFCFTTQPNMILDIPLVWNSEVDYTASLLKKYRDQFKRARKKSAGITTRDLTLPEIESLSSSLHDLYMTVARNAPFNTFYLQPNHIAVMKEKLGEKLIINGYFDGPSLIGFNTMIKNGHDIDTYFLGYDENMQREKMLYLNMLYDMLAKSVELGAKRIIFARTALEIKSSVGAVPVDMKGYIKHANPMLNKYMSVLFRLFEPETKWQQRHPFKPSEPQPSSAGEGF